MSLFEKSLRILSTALKSHYGKKVYILIDEYDAPLNHAYKEAYFGEVVKLMRNFLGAGLKDNPYLEKGILTGILRIAKANIFSDRRSLHDCVIKQDFHAMNAITIRGEKLFRPSLAHPDVGTGSAKNVLGNCASSRSHRTRLAALSSPSLAK